ncbi:transcriptional regulator, Sir2 family [Onchocerca flexuosa]|uniref:protein acetyllysine N-acetyltransferase n=1 Tax=Onchocerca flexuosa TaxID=387005 RepID=A0A238BLQ7_9BILA|nr:transcriptional regulator, Sir2 family [Onchocerca flexuosa]
MAMSYAKALSPYDNKGVLGLPEIIDDHHELERKVGQLAELLLASHCCVIHTGAGISTAAGIPDFRGPKGLWTLEARNELVNDGVSFVEATPTYTHYGINALESKNIVKFVITQNVDGLHIRSGYPLNRIAELHGNVFVEKCARCSRRYYRDIPTGSIGLKPTGKRCEGTNSGRPCRGMLHDFCLDWEDPLPEEDLCAANEFARNADLSICMGTTLQITPAGDLPLLTKKNGGKIVIINLSKTKYDQKADLIINGRVDDVMQMLMAAMNIAVVQKFNPDFVVSLSIHPLERCTETDGI